MALGDIWTTEQHLRYIQLKYKVVNTTLFPHEALEAVVGLAHLEPVIVLFSRWSKS